MVDPEISRLFTEMEESRGQHEALVRLRALNSSSVDIAERILLLTKEAPVAHIGRTSRRKSSLEASATNAYFNCPVMSRHHAELKMDHDKRKVYLRDVGSLHGTQYNRLSLRRDETRAIKTGDVLTFGTHIDRGSDKFTPYQVSAKVEWRHAKRQDQPTTYRVPDDTDIEEISADEDNGLVYARQVLQHNNFRPAPSGLIDLTTNDPDETVEPVEGRRHFSYDPYSPRYGPSTYVGLTPQKLRPSKEPENLDFNEIPTEKSTEKPRNIHDSIGDESIISNYSEHDNLSTQSASVASDALPQEHDDSDDESDGSSWKEYDYGGSDEEEEVEKEEELAQYNDSAANFHQPSSLLSTDARHGRFPDAHEVTSQEFNETPRDGNKVSGSQMLPVVLSPLAFLDQVDDPATIDTGDDVPQAASTTFNVSMHQIQDQGQQPPPHHTVEKQNTEYLHAREENRRVLGLPSRTGSGEVDEQPIGQEKASDEADAQDDETLSWNDQPSLAFASNLSNDLVKSGAKFLRTPFTNDFILTPAVQAPSPVLDETSAYQFEMSKLAAEVGVNSENPPDKSIKAIVDDNDTSQDKTTPTKRKAEDISQSSQKEEEAVQPKAVEAPTTTCQLVQNPEQEVAELAPVSTLPCQPTASVSLDLPRPAKRLRRAAEVVGYAAIGGIAVMSALIATAPAL